MTFDKRSYNIYLVTAVIAAGLLFMALSLWHIAGDIDSQSSVDLAIDRMVDECWEKNGLDEKLGETNWFSWE